MNRYAQRVRSVADHHRRLTALDLSRLTAWERVALALRLGDEDVALYRSVHGISDHDARARLRRARAIGRVPSRSNDL